MSHYDEKDKRTLAVYIFIFILLAAGIAISGYLSYRNFEQEFRLQTEHQLSAIAELKVSGLVNWRKERLADAEVLYQNPAFVALVQSYFENTGDIQAQTELLVWLEKYQAYDQYEQILLLDPQGRQRISVPSALEATPQFLVEQNAAALASGQVTFMDFHRDTEGDSIHLTILIPILDTENANQPLGTIVLQIDPQTYLYPFIQSWPTLSTSAETLLIRRDGNDALFLNELRFNPDAALTLRYPLKRTTLPAVKAVLGQTGVVEGVDYRGEPVLADVRAVPDSPWFLVSKMDTAEVYAPLRVRLWGTFGLAGMAIFVAGAGLVTVWRQQRILFYRAQAEAAEALRNSEARYRRLFEAAKDGILILDAETGVVIDVNPFLIEMLGFSQEEIRGKELWELGFFKDIAANKTDFLELQQKEYIRYENLPLETAGGRRFYVEFVSNVYQVDHHRVVQCNIRDITERKQAEEKLRESEKSLREAQRLAHIGDWQWTVATDAVKWSEELHHINGRDPNLPAPSYAEMPSCYKPESWERLSTMVARALQSGESYELDLEIVRPDGTIRHTSTRGEADYDASGKITGLHGTVQDITERKQEEEVSRRVEATLAEAQRISRLGSWDWDLATGKIQFSDEMFRLVGMIPREAEFTREEFAKFLHPDEVERILLEFLQSTAAHSSDIEHQLVQLDGKIQNVRSRIKAYCDENGTPFRLFGSTQDITERKQAEDALRDSQAQVTGILNSAMDAIITVDEEQKIVIFNPSAEQMFGCPASEAIGQTLERFLPEYVRKEHSEYMRVFGQSNLTKRSMKTPALALTCLRADGEAFPSEVSISQLEIGGQKLYTAIVRDITERKQAQEQLTASEVRYRRLFETARDGILILDAESGVVIDVNPFLIEMLGFSQEEIRGKELWELGFFKDIAANKANFLELQQKEYIRYEDLPLETADGRRLSVEFVSNVYQVNHHKVVQCNIRDITERKRAEQQLANYTDHLEEIVDARTSELREAHEQLVRQERLATLGQLAGSIGHELRNPLGVISNAVYFLKMAQPDASDKVKEYLTIIENEAHTSDKIVTDLLDFTRLKSVEREAISVSELIRQTLERFPTPPSVEVTLEIPSDLPKVYADPHHIVQVLGNLIVNACQAMPQGGLLSLYGNAQDDMILITIKDSGVGIPPQNMQKLFEPLFTTKIKGIGLGLAVSRKLTEANGGRIEVQSEAGKGSTFVVWLPVQRGIEKQEP